MLAAAAHSALSWGVTVLLLRGGDLRPLLDSGDLLRPAAFVALVLCSVVLHFTVSAMDPGYVVSDPESEMAVTTEDQEKLIGRPSKAPPLRRCGYCMLQQPMRARHCQSCQHCVRRYDHHCPWIENCVGERNHALFVLYLSVQLAALLWAFHLSWSGFHGEVFGRDWLWNNALVLVAFITVAIFTMVVMILLVSHLYLISCNVTTWEFMSHHRISYLKHYDMDTNPFDRGVICNLWGFFCRCHSVVWERVYFQDEKDPV